MHVVEVAIRYKLYKQAPYEPARESLILIAYAHKPHLNVYADVYIGARGLNFGLNLPLLPYFEDARCECFGETARMRRLA